MKGNLRISNQVEPLKLVDFKYEAFLYQGDIHISLYDPQGIKKVKGKIPVFNLNIPGIVHLPPEAEIEPIDVEIIGT